jgi:4-hydroxy-tetrahydrodipicolinate reductase
LPGRCRRFHRRGRRQNGGLSPRGYPGVSTTGLADRHRDELQSATRDIAMVYRRNMSVGVWCSLNFESPAAGPGWDIEITETHHRDKTDAPSGTALQLGEAIASELGGRLDELAVFDRFATRAARRPGSIGFSSIRAGSVVGDHDVLFATNEEIIHLQHRALDRTTFARGALRAARWVANRPAGLYDMADVLGLGPRPPP